MRRFALVTAGGQGLGRALVQALGRAGWSVFVHHHHSRAGAEAAAAEVRAAGGEAFLLGADLSTGPGREGLCAALEAELAGRPLGLLLNNLGVYPPEHLLETTLAGFEHTFTLGCTAVFHLTQLCLPALRRGPGGLIINLGDARADRVEAHDDAPPYYIAKLGVHLLTRSYAQALGPEGIRVNMVSPGFLDNSVGTPGSPLPLGRKGRFADVAQAVLWLCSDQASYVSGANLTVSGGWAL